MKKKILVLCLCVILATIAMVFGTMAYFTDTASANTATVTVGSVRIKWADDTGKTLFDNEESTKLMPGISQTETLVVENIGNNDAYIRIHIIFPSEDAADLFNVQFGEDAVLVESAPIEGTGSNTYGYTYLFKDKVAGKTGKASIKTSITLKGTLDHNNLTALQNGVKVMLLAEAIQTTSFKDASDAFAHFYDSASSETTTPPAETTTTTN